jgi:hypothetical protein
MGLLDFSKTLEKKYASYSSDRFKIHEDISSPDPIESDDSQEELVDEILNQILSKSSEWNDILKEIVPGVLEYQKDMKVALIKKKISEILNILGKGKPIEDTHEEEE